MGTFTTLRDKHGIDSEKLSTFFFSYMSHVLRFRLGWSNTQFSNQVHVDVPPLTQRSDRDHEI